MSIVDSIVDRITATLDAKANETRNDPSDFIGEPFDLEGHEARKLWDHVARALSANVDPEFESHQEAQLAALHVASFADAIVEARRDFFAAGGEEEQ